MASTPLRRKGVFLAVSAVALLPILYAFRSILVPFILALALAYVFSPVVTRITLLGGKKRPLPRWIAVLGLYTALLAGLVFFSIAFLPRLADELGMMMKEVPAAFRHVREEWLPALAEAYEENLSPLLRSRRADVISRAEPKAEEPEQERSAAIVLRPARDGSYRIELQDLSIDVRRAGNDTVVLNARPPSRAPPAESGGLEETISDVVRDLLERGQEHATVLFSVGQEVVLFLIGFAFTFFITLMLSAFILADQDRILAFFESLVPQAWRPDYNKVLHSLDQGLAGVVRGQILICLINGTLSGIGFAIADLRYWPVLTAIATVFTLIPIFGTIISSVPAILIGLTQSWTTGLFVLGWVTVIHLGEAYVLDPKIIGKTARIHPVVIFFALIAGERAAGLLGVLLGVPVASILQNASSGRTASTPARPNPTRRAARGPLRPKNRPSPKRRGRRRLSAAPSRTNRTGAGIATPIAMVQRSCRPAPPGGSVRRFAILPRAAATNAGVGDRRGRSGERLRHRRRASSANRCASCSPSPAAARIARRSRRARPPVDVRDPFYASLGFAERSPPPPVPASAAAARACCADEAVVRQALPPSLR